MDPVGLWFYLFVFSDLFCWWFFPDCAMVNHLLGIIFCELFPKHRRWWFFEPCPGKLLFGVVLLKVFYFTTKKIWSPETIERGDSSGRWSTCKEQVAFSLLFRTSKRAHPKKIQLHRPSSSLHSYERVIFPSLCCFFFGVHSQGDKKENVFCLFVGYLSWR